MPVHPPTRRSIDDPVDEGEVQETFEENVHSSRLLSLPIELRLRILSFLLNGVHIHMGQSEESLTAPRLDVLPWHHPPPRYSYNGKLDWRAILNGQPPKPPPPCHTCCATMESAADAQSTATTRPPCCWEHHPACFPLPPIWQVCRRLHNEALAMLFSGSNLFSFSPALKRDVDAGHVKLPVNFSRSITKIWIPHGEALVEPIDSLGVPGLESLTEVHVARNHVPQSEMGSGIYGIAPLWLTSPFEIEAESLENRRALLLEAGIELIVHERA